MISVSLFGAATAVAAIGAVIVTMSKTGEQETLGGVLVLAAAFIAAGGGLALVAGV